MADISKEKYGKNGIETIVDNDGILWLNERHIEEGLDYKNLRETQYHIIQITENKDMNQQKNQKNNAIEFLQKKN